MQNKNTWERYVEDIMSEYLIETQEGFSLLFDYIMNNYKHYKKFEELLFFMTAKPIRDDNHKIKYSVQILGFIEDCGYEMIEREYNLVYGIVKDKGLIQP